MKCFRLRLLLVLGLLDSCFRWVYGMLVPIAGGFGDVLSRRNLIAIALLVWSAATFSSALAGGFVLLLVWRAVTVAKAAAASSPLDSRAKGLQ